MKKLLCGGISTCDVYVTGAKSLPEPNTAQEVDRIFFQIGGGAANAMIDYCKLGGACTLCIRVGRDHAGRVILDSLAPYANRMALSVAYDDGPTAITIALTGDRDRSFLAALGTTLKFCPEDIPDQALRESDLVYLSGVCLMHGFDCPGLTEFLRRCRALGKTTIVDTAPDMRNVWLPTIEEALPYIDYFIPSQAEAEALTGLTDADAMMDFFAARGSGTVVLKWGARGVYLRTADDRRQWVPGFRVPVADTTGAGDSFCAGFCYGLAKEWDLLRSVIFGNAVGAFCVSQMGASAGIPPEAQVLRFIRENDGTF